MGTFTLSQFQEGAELVLYPDADGCNIDFTPVGDTNNWECVDDSRLNPDDDTTYVVSTVTLTEYDFYTLENHTSETGTINYVKVFARGKSHLYEQHIDGIYKLIVTDNACGNIYKSDDNDLLTNTYTTFGNIWNTNLRTATAWTWADIDNLQIGVEVSSPSLISDLTTTLRPDAVGDSSDFTGSGCANNYQCVDDVDSDGDDTYVYANGVVRPALNDLYNIENHTTESGTISKIVIFALLRQDGGGSSPKVKIGLKTGGTEYWETQFNINHQDYRTYTEEWVTNPDTALAWTWANIDALQIGVNIFKGALDDEVFCTRIYAVVYYTEEVNAEIRTTQAYAVVNYDGDVVCTLDKPEEISVDATQNIKMLNFWSGNRAVYGLSRNNKTMVLTGIQYSTDACTKMECIRGLAEHGGDVISTGFDNSNYEGSFKILSFGYRKISDKPLAFSWILEMEFSA